MDTNKPIDNVRIFNNLGQEFNLSTFLFDKKIQMDIKSIPCGVYYISLAYDGGTSQSTFIKQ
uniref:T9SS type A sorting domain-containing protein n=1 Tax=Flavobacterium sp. TaxID=239 RepID=UPI00404B1EF6